MHTLMTIGYTGRTPADLKQIVEAHDAHLVDIRLLPTSRVPHWKREALQALLGERYTWMVSLGNVNYNTGGPVQLLAPARAVDPILDLLVQRNVILLCACKDAATCHRTNAAAYLAAQLGCAVEHLPPPPPQRERTGTATLTLTQPWASLVALGKKQIETRSWQTAYRGPLLIHAGKGLAGMTKRQFADLLRREPFWSALRPLIAGDVHYFRPDALPRGAIVARCDLVDIVPVERVQPAEPERSFGNYDPGRSAWLLANIRPIDPPVPATGRQGLWWYDVEQEEVKR